MEFIPKYIKKTEDKRASEIITHEDWNKLFNLVINQGDWNTKALVDLCKELEGYSNTAQIIQMINEKVKEISSADMTQQDYDTNSDGIVNKADSVVDGSITTESIQDGAVTAVKLETILKNRIDYCYSKVGLLLVLVSAQNEITGSENLNLFGLDGTLETGYNIETEQTNLLLNTTGYYTGSFVINHYLENASDLLQTNKNYTITNNLDLGNVKLTNIANAVFTSDTINSELITIPQYLGSTTNYRRENIKQGYVVHIKDNFYYIIVTADYERTKTDTIHECILVYPTTCDGNSISISAPIEISTDDFDSVFVIGEYMYIMSADNVQSIGEHSVTIFNATGDYKTLTYYNDSADQHSDFNFSGNGNIYYSNYYKYDRETCLYKYSFATSSTTRLLVMEDATSTSAININPITGRWGTVTTKDSEGIYEYYALDFHSGALTKIEKTSELYLSRNCVRDTDGIHFYQQGKKYRIDESGSVKVLVDTIKNGEIIDNLRFNQSWIHNNTFIYDNKVYGIINKTCIAVYDIKNVNYSYSSIAAVMGIKSITEGLLLDYAPEQNYSWGVVPYSFTEGSITLETALDKDILGELYIERQQKCTVPVNSIKQIYLKPTVSNTFNTVNLIVYLNRELQNDDILTVTINNNILTPLEASTSTTKYYELSLGEATSDFEVLITVKAGATRQLQLTQILGGVDNAV